MSDLPCRDDGDARYESAVQRCPQCGRTYRVMADEVGMHDCPRCGAGHDDEGDDE